MMIDELKQKTIGFVSLGCDKNRVDLEKMIFDLSQFGFKINNNPSEANIIIINTCSFLESARLESIETIIEMSEYKNNANLEKLIVTGCLNELNYPDLAESLPEVDAFVNVKDNENIVNIIFNLYNFNDCYGHLDGRILTTPKHYAYLKISEGCNNFCTYCLIPYIRGRYKSTAIEVLVEEAKTLARKGVKELILVAQDVTKYGVDLYKKKMLVPLLQELSKIDDIKWIRLLYCYPEEIDDALINEIKLNSKIVKYLDIPLQHVSTDILKSMNRRSSHEGILSLFSKLKTEIPNIVLRTTFIIGFPGENDKDIQLIADFLKKYKLHNVGFFAYSREEGTKAYSLQNQIDDKTKQDRIDMLSSIQYDIVLKLNNSLLNNTVEVVIDEVYDGYSIGRYYGQSPMIDTIIYFNQELNPGEIYRAKITNILDYDLEGEIL